MPNPLAQAQQSAIRANDQIGNSFGRFGTAVHPRGFVLAAYRNANRALANALTEENKLQAAQEVMRGLKVQLASDIRAELSDMQSFGLDEASRQLSYYGIKKPAGILSTDITQALNAAVLAITSRVDVQASAVTALILTDASPDQIVGNRDRAGTLTSGAILSGAAYWSAALVWDAFSWLVSQQQETFQKQAIAALDARTTQCCLEVHGQIQPLNGKFHLTGDPHFADDMDWSPFHWYCRTSCCLYQAQFDDGLTAAMRAGADTIMAERAAGGSGDRNPANGFAG